MDRMELLKKLNAKPIIFNTENVRATLAGRKTMIRCNPFQFKFKNGKNPNFTGYVLGEHSTGNISSGLCLYSRGYNGMWNVCTNVVKPKYRQGDILYVRETFSEVETVDGRPYYVYKADDNGKYYKHQYSSRENFDKWRSPRTMPKEAARIFLRVTNICAERLKTLEKLCMEQISDIEKEGFSRGHAVNETWYERGLKDYIEFWNSNLKESDIPVYGWDANPWVWIVEYEVIDLDLLSKEL